MKNYTKLRVNEPGYWWEHIDTGTALLWEDSENNVQLYRQRSDDRVGIDGDIYFEQTDHYRFKVNGRWHRKRFFGETAWMDVERYANDEFGVEVSA